MTDFLKSSQSICTKRIFFKEKLGFFALSASALLVLVIMSAALMYIFWKGGAQAFSWNYLFSSTPVAGGTHKVGILYPLIGTLYLIVCSILIATPIGVFAAIYLNEYANPQALLTKWSRFAIESLAGIPSVIYGLFGLAFFASFLGFRQSMLAGSLTVAIMILPVIIRTAEEAIDSVPRSYRDASFALGANKVQTILKVVLPSAAPGVFTGVMLSVGRAIAESAILILVAGGNIISAPRFLAESYPFLLPDSGRTLAAHVYLQATSYDDVSGAFAASVVLILLILILNLFAFLSLSLGGKFRAKK